MTTSLPDTAAEEMAVAASLADRRLAGADRLEVSHAAIQAAWAASPGPNMALMLQKCLDRFCEYEISHAAKNTADGDAKAARNRDMADQIRAALATFKGEGG